MDDISSGGAQIVLSCKPEDLMNHAKARRVVSVGRAVGRLRVALVGQGQSQPLNIYIFFDHCFQ